MGPLIAASIAFCTPMTSSPPPAASAVVDSFIGAFNSQDAAALAGTLTKNAIIVRWPERVEPASLVENYRDNLFKLPTPYRMTVVQRLTGDDLVAETESVTRGTSREDMLVVYRVDRGCIISVTISKTLSAN
ncbi:hypothetical protein QO010_000733 [Caulobacter ginsengisoli]|uniref:SnoaL-like domain-containing protein n=1 Tax=Caulobacter ginsengisoli TaxID=400775 RepID=A0ABU0ILT2_9CAUL|nr:hypothetical protein [Caulobacter ginsengisoli]MDQ0462985.1 hypothetical protein [Caulobacter ginsengisoli]